MRVRAHPAFADRMEIRNLGHRTAFGVKEFFRPIGLHPFLQLLEVRPVLACVGERHLMAAPKALDEFPVDLLRTGPSLRRAENDHWPGWASGGAALTILTLYLSDAVQADIKRGGELLMHGCGVITLNNERLMTISTHQSQQLFGGNAVQNGGARDLVAVEMQDRQHRAIADRIQNLV